MNLVLSLLIALVGQLRTFHGHSWFILSVAISDDFLFSGSVDGTVKQWSISTGDLIRSLEAGVVFSLAVSGDFVYSGSTGRTARQWSISTGALVRSFSGHSWSIYSVEVSGDSLFTGSYDNITRQWSISSGVLIRNFSVESSGVYALEVSGDFLFCGSADGVIRQWSISSGDLIRNFIGHTDHVWSVAVNSDFLFSGSSDATIKQWSISSGDLIRTFIGHTDRIWSVAANGDFLFSGSSDTTIKQWSISSGRLIRNFTGHTSWIRGIAISDDFLFSGSADETIKQWCAGSTYQSGSQCLPCPANAQCSVANFTCNSGYIASNGACYSNYTTNTTRTTAIKTSTDLTSTTLNPPPQQPNDASSNMITYIAGGGIVLVVIVAIGFFTASLYHRKNQAGKTLSSTDALTNRRMINPAVTLNSTSVLNGQNYLTESSIRKIFPSYNCNVVNDTVNSYIMSDISSTANNNSQQSLSTNQLYATNNTWTKTGPSTTFNTTTMFTYTHQGLYLPGNFLLSSTATLLRPLSRVLHSNRSCKVECFQVLDTELRQRCRTDIVAVKTLHVLNQNNVDTFFQEISIMYYFRGKPNIAQLVGFCDSPLQLLTDFYSLGSLEQALLLDSRVIQPSKLVAIQFSLQMSGALDQMHQNGFSHSDIKALNVFVDRDNNNGGALQCYLGDFGLAQVLDDTHLVVKSYRIFNRKGLTAAYAAPEMLKRFRGGINDASKEDFKAGDFLRADIYSLGVLLYEILNCLGAWK